MSLTPRQLIDELAGMELEWVMADAGIRCTRGDCPIIALCRARWSDNLNLQNCRAIIIGPRLLDLNYQDAGRLIDVADDNTDDESLRQYMIDRLRPKAR